MTAVHGSKPIDLLPIRNPLTESPDATFFYDNVVKPLVPDVLRMEANGIPIDLNKVKELETVVDNVIENVHSKLKDNEAIIQFLYYIFGNKKKEALDKLHEEAKTPEHFYKPFDIKNKIHRSLVINLYLLDKEHAAMQMAEWTVKDLKKLNQILASKFLQDLIDKTLAENHPLVLLAMKRLAEDKAVIYNKNRLQKKEETLDNKALVALFNPGSADQKRKLFEYYGIDSESETKSGNPQWSRDELERVQRLLKSLIEEQEHDS